MTLSALQQAY